MSEIRQIALSSLKSNPFRDLKQFPLLQWKIDKLIESISAEGLWEGIIARPSGKNFEIAFGHHRVSAAQKSLGNDAHIPVIVRELTDEEMLHFMDRENAEEHGWDFYNTTVQAVRAAVLAFGAGKVKFPEVDLSHGGAKGNLREAPSFQKGVGPQVGPNSQTYTAESLATFLGRVKEATGKPRQEVLTALDALELLELGGFEPRAIIGMNHSDARIVVGKAKAEYRRAMSEAAEREKENERKRIAIEHQKELDIAKERREYDAKVKREGEERARKDKEALEANQRKLEAEKAKNRRDAEKRDEQDRIEAATRASKALQFAIDRLQGNETATDLRIEQQMDKVAKAKNAKPYVAIDLEPKVVRVRERLESLSLPDVDSVLILLYDPAHACPINEVRKLEKVLSEKAGIFTKWRQQASLCVKKRGKK